MAIPAVIPIEQFDEYHTELVGRCSGNRQFFLNSFFFFVNSERIDYLILYLFDSDGRLISHRYQDLGRTVVFDRESDESIRIKRLFRGICGFQMAI